MKIGTLDAGEAREPAMKPSISCQTAPLVAGATAHVRRQWLGLAWLIALPVCFATSGCNQTPPPKRTQPEQVAKVEPAEGKGESTKPRVGPNPGLPVETAPPNVPEHQPAFPEQTRAPAVHTRAKFNVAEVASELAQPWALAFLPDARMLVTSKHRGQLYVVSPDGRKSPPVPGVPAVDGQMRAAC